VRAPAFHPLVVSEVERLTDDAVALTFAVPPELAEDYRFTQGQHLTIRWSPDGADVRRNYSICASAVTGPLRVAVKAIPGGVFSSYATTALAPGEVLEVLTPTGHFFTPLDPGQARHYAAIAAGSGITPVLSLLTTALEVEPHSRATLIFGNRSTASILFLDELADLKDRFPDRFALVHVLSGEAQDAELLSGRIDRERLPRLLDALLPVPAVDEWFLCGPLEMIETARAELLARGVDPGHVHAEVFHVGASAPVARLPRARTGGADDAATVSVQLGGRTSTFPLSPDGPSVLEALLAVRADAPYACKGGVCGTCRAVVVEGRVEMDRNYALEADEIAKGVVLACQSHPLTDRVTLDFDA